jgi:hypothetical protein
MEDEESQQMKLTLEHSTFDIVSRDITRKLNEKRFTLITLIKIPNNIEIDFFFFISKRERMIFF